MTGLAALPPEAARAPLVLASASPRRQEILGAAGLPFAVRASNAEPAPAAGQSPEEHVVVSAEAKALAVAESFAGRLVLGADTVVVLGREILGKPADAAEAVKMLRRLSGRQHAVYTGLALVTGKQPRVVAKACERSLVTFHPLSDEAIATYVASGEPLDKAGAYGIQSGGGALVAEVIGSYLNVVGLPLARLRAMLTTLGWTFAGD